MLQIDSTSAHLKTWRRMKRTKMLNLCFNKHKHMNNMFYVYTKGYFDADEK